MRSISLTLLSGKTSWSTKVCGFAVTVVLLQFSSSRSCQWTEVPLESDHTRSNTHFRLQFRSKHVRSWGCQFHAFHDLGLMSLTSLCHLWLPHQFSKALHIAELLPLCKKKCSKNSPLSSVGSCGGCTQWWCGCLITLSCASGSPDSSWYHVSWSFKVCL